MSGETEEVYYELMCALKYYHHEFCRAVALHKNIRKHFVPSS